MHSFALDDTSIASYSQSVVFTLDCSAVPKCESGGGKKKKKL